MLTSFPGRRRPREDALPETALAQGAYRDVGCDIHPSCLTCPLPRCRYDMPGGARAMLNRVRDEQIRHLRLECGVPVDEIATRFQVSRRTVFRVLQQGRPADGLPPLSPPHLRGRARVGGSSDGPSGPHPQADHPHPNPPPSRGRGPDEEGADDGER